MTPSPPPHRISGHWTLRPDLLPEAQRAELAARLFALHERIFAGVSLEGFRAHVIDPPAQRTAIRVFAGETGEAVGYCAVHRYTRRIGGRTVIVLRAEAGLLPDWRGRGSTYWFGMVEALREKLRHPLTPVHYLGTLVHPSSYHLFCKYFPRVYPHPHRGLPDHIRATALEIADSFPDPAVDPADPMVRDVGWITIETPAEAALRARAGELEDVAFYEARNPGFREGHGLVVLVPITAFNVATAILRRLAEVARHAVTRRPPRL